MTSKESENNLDGEGRRKNRKKERHEDNSVPDPPNKRGGKREGAGRPKGTGKWGEPTKAIRLPESKIPQIMLYVERLCMKMLEEFVVYPTKERSRIPKPSKMDRMFGCPILDDSMSPELYKDEIALIYPQLSPENGDTVLAYYDGRLYIRKYQLLKDKITS